MFENLNDDSKKELVGVDYVRMKLLSSFFRVVVSFFKLF